MKEPPAYRYAVTTFGGALLINEPRVSPLTQVIRLACDRLKLAVPVGYDKVWGAIRHDGACTVVVSLAGLPGQQPGALGVIVFSYALGHEQPLVPRRVKVFRPKAGGRGSASGAAEELLSPPEAAPAAGEGVGPAADLEHRKKKPRKKRGNK